jgi:hypothetical protein
MVLVKLATPLFVPFNKPSFSAIIASFFSSTAWEAAIPSAMARLRSGSTIGGLI